MVNLLSVFLKKKKETTTQLPNETIDCSVNKIYKSFLEVSNRI